ILRGLASVWRFSTQSTLIYTFPFVFPLAVYGFWSYRDSGAVRVLAAVFSAIVLGHLVQPEGSFSFIGEPYWFEAYFAFVGLAAGGLLCLFHGRRMPRSHAIAAILLLTVIQVAMTAAACPRMDNPGLSRRVVRRTAERYGDRHCVVFLEDNPPAFY